MKNPPSPLLLIVLELFSWDTFCIVLNVVFKKVLDMRAAIDGSPPREMDLLVHEKGLVSVRIAQPLPNNIFKNIYVSREGAEGKYDS